MILTNAQIKEITGVSASDDALDYWQEMALSILASELGVVSFLTHDVEFEKVRVLNPDYLSFADFPVEVSTIEIFEFPRHTSEIMGYTFRADQRDLKKVWVLTATGDSTPMLPCEVFASYTAGFRAVYTLELEDNNVSGETITHNGITYTIVVATPTDDEILLGASAEETATNIATKLSATSSGEIVTFNVGDNVSASSGFTVTAPNVPIDIKTAIAYIVAGGVQDTAGSEKISSYRIGSKQVNYRTDSEKTYIESTIEKYVNKYKDPIIIG